MSWSRNPNGQFMHCWFKMSHYSCFKNRKQACKSVKWWLSYLLNPNLNQRSRSFWLILYPWSQNGVNPYISKEPYWDIELLAPPEQSNLTYPHKDMPHSGHLLNTVWPQDWPLPGLLMTPSLKGWPCLWPLKGQRTQAVNQDPTGDVSFSRFV